MTQIILDAIRKELDVITKARSRMKKADKRLRQLLAELRDTTGDSPISTCQTFPKVDDVTRERARRILRASSFLESK